MYHHIWQFYMALKHLSTGARLVAQRLRAHTDFPEDLSSDPIPSLTPAPRDQMPYSGLWGVCGEHAYEIRM